MTSDQQAETSAETSAKPEEQDNRRKPPVSVVGIGSSAGGLEALSEFFRAMPEDSGLAFVVVSHLDPRHDSMLPKLLQGKTRMRVRQITDNMGLAANQVYVIPPDKGLAMLNSSLQLMERKKTDLTHRPIDAFFRSLATDQGSKAVGIVLSGTGSDGTLGIRAIKAEAGLILVQDQASAKFDGMPASARATGLADFILPPEEMPASLVQYARHYDQLAKNTSRQEESTAHALERIFVLIRSVTGHDFSLYKRNTIHRRIERRMYVHQLQTMGEYVSYLNESEREVSILFKELLIGVTSFFRDPEAFDLLKEKYLKQLLLAKPNGYQFRIWVPGCSSGEEAYSVAILVQECLELLGRNLNVQLFGTDLDEEAINVARAGIYPSSIEIDVDARRLERFFTKIDDHYQIKKNIREMVVFAEQNVIKDPPFTKLDMLCCRNLLIYFGPVLQEKLLPTFHYSLKKGGILFLGTSENIGAAADQFTLLDKKWKIFERRDRQGSIAQLIDLPKPKALDRLPEENTVTIAKASREAGTIRLLKAILGQIEAPVCVVVDDKADLIYAHGRTGRFLEIPEGEASSNVLEMARPGLKAGLTNAIRRMANERTEIVIENLQVKDNGRSQDVNLIVKPLPEIQRGLRGLMLIIFDEIPHQKKSGTSEGSKQPRAVKNQELKRLEDELRFTRENLQTTIEELETSNEELKSTNEELQSANEELQSTNEELETSKEELQSLNEEAATVNSELQGRIDELVSANDDIKNLLDATDIATIFLDSELNIRRFTPLVGSFFHLTPFDIGRSIEHFASTLIEVDIKEHARQVLRTLDKFESVIEDGEGQKYRMRVRPFRTVDNVIEGVVITFLNVTDFLQTIDGLNESEASWQMLLRDSPVATLVVTDERIGYVNPAGCSMFGASSPEVLVDTSILDRVARQCRDQFATWLQLSKDQRDGAAIVEVGEAGEAEEAGEASEVQYLRLDGSNLACEACLVPLVYRGRQSTALYLRAKETPAAPAHEQGRG